jgi:hypothetical protein
MHAYLSLFSETASLIFFSILDSFVLLPGHKDIPIQTGKAIWLKILWLLVKAYF